MFCAMLHLSTRHETALVGLGDIFCMWKARLGFNTMNLNPQWRKGYPSSVRSGQEIILLQLVFTPSRKGCKEGYWITFFYHSHI